MTPRERLMVSRLAIELVEQADAPKDRDAETELAALVKVRADAPYLLLQRALILQDALNGAQEEIERLRSQSAGLGAGAGGGLQTPASAPAMTSAVQGSSFAPPASLQATAAPAAPAAGGFLRNAATIGAGVLGGSLLFQGIESLLHGRGGSFLGGGTSGADVTPRIETTTNNYFSDADRGLTGDGRFSGNDSGTDYFSRSDSSPYYVS